MMGDDMKVLRSLLLATVFLSTAGCATIIDTVQGQRRAIDKSLSGDISTTEAVVAGDFQLMTYRFDNIKERSRSLNCIEQVLYREYMGFDNEKKAFHSACDKDKGEQKWWVGTDKADGSKKALVASKLPLYLEGRAIEVRDYCGLYFEGLSQLSRTSARARETVGNVFNLASVIVGVTGAAAEQLSILAGTEAFIQSEWDGFNRYNFLMPDTHKLRRIIFEKLAAYETDNPMASQDTLKKATDWVRGYSTLCTELGIKEIVDIEFAPKPLDFEAVYGRRNEMLQLQKISNDVGGLITSETLQLLYWRFILGPSNEKQLNDINGKLKDTMAYKYVERLEKDAQPPAPEPSDDQEKKKSEEKRKQANKSLSEFRDSIAMLGGYNKTAETAEKLKQKWEEEEAKAAAAKKERCAANPSLDECKT